MRNSKINGFCSQEEQAGVHYHLLKRVGPTTLHFLRVGRYIVLSFLVRRGAKCVVLADPTELALSGLDAKLNTNRPSFAGARHQRTPSKVPMGLNSSIQPAGALRTVSPNKNDFMSVGPVDWNSIPIERQESTDMDLFGRAGTTTIAGAQAQEVNCVIIRRWLFGYTLSEFGSLARNTVLFLFLGET